MNKSNIVKNIVDVAKNIISSGMEKHWYDIPVSGDLQKGIVVQIGFKDIIKPEDIEDASKLAYDTIKDDIKVLKRNDFVDFNPFVNVEVEGSNGILVRAFSEFEVAENVEENEINDFLKDMGYN